MRLPIVLALALVACGPAAKHAVTTPPVVVVPPLPPPFVVANASSITTFVTDAKNLYWADDAGIYRRPLGPDQKAERLFATPYVSYLAPGDTELFFVDGDGHIRAVPLAGGTPRDLDPTEEMPWALYAEGDTVWYAFDETLYGVSPSGRKTIALEGVLAPAFAAADGHAYVVRYDGATDKYRLLDVELATGSMTSISDADFVSETQSIAIVGDELVLAVAGAVVAVPRKGGKARYSFFGQASGVAGDATGYAVGGYGFVVTHAPRQAPHLVATGTPDDSVTGINTLAVAGDYVYYTSTSNNTGDMTLRAAARTGGATMLRLPVNSAVTALGATSDGVFAGIENENGDALFQVGTRKTKLISPSGYIDTIAADDKNVVVIASSELLGTERAGGDLASISEVSYATPVLHKGKVYWGEGPVIRAASLPSGNPFQVIDTSTLREDLIDLVIGAVAFANDHLFFSVPFGDKVGIMSVDEKREISWLWTYEPGVDEYGTLDSSVVAVGDHLFIHDGTYIYRVALDGTSKRVFSGLPKREDDLAFSVTQLFAAGDRLIARVYGAGDMLVEIPTDGGKPKTIWESSLDGNGLQNLAVAPDAVYVHVSELGSILKIPLQ